MLKMFLALSVTVLGSTAAMASAPGNVVGLGLGAIHERQSAPDGLIGSDQDGSREGKVILARGDQSASGPGAGGQKGKKRGGGKGNQKEGKDNKGQGQDKGKSKGNS